MQDKHRKRVLIVACVLAVAVGLFVWVLIHHSAAPTSDDIPDISVTGDRGYNELPENEVVVQAVTGFCFKADTLEQFVDIPNDANNLYSFAVTICLGDGTVLYESPIIQPGGDITSLQLSEALPEGIYENSIMAYRFCSTDDSHTVVSQCEFPIEIRCVN